MEVSHEVLSEIGKVRSHNEDSFGFDEQTPNGKVYVVCDGMGGHVGGAIASGLAVKSIIEYFKREEYDNLILAIDKALQFANEQIFVHTLADPSLQGMGTTAVVLVIKKEDCFIGHVGDSRIYLKTQGQLHRLTKDHSFVQKLVDSGAITDDEAERHPQKNQILSALGHTADVKGSVCKSPIKVQKDDVFMLCSDGLNGLLHDSLMQEMIDPKNLQLTKSNLFNAAMDNGGHDNITILLVGVNSSSHYKKSEFKSFNPSNRNSGRDDNSHLSTSHFPSGTGSKKTIPKKNNLTKIIAGLSILICMIAVGFVVYLNSGPKTPPGPPTSPIDSLSKYDLENMNFADLKDSANKKPFVTDIKNEDQIITNDGKTVILTIEDDKLVAVKEKTVDPPPPPPPPSNDDKDGDGVINSKDKCPTVRGDKSNNGCPATPPPVTPVDPNNDPIGHNKDGSYTIKINLGGETIKQLRDRIKNIPSIACKKPSDSDELRILNNSKKKKIIPDVESEKIAERLKITFKCQ